MIAADLAGLRSVATKALNEAVKRNAARFPKDFMFQHTLKEKQEPVANCDHLAKLMIEDWRTHHQEVRPHSSLYSATPPEFRRRCVENSTT